MKVIIIGYGKMGKAIEQILKERGHQVTYVIDQHNTADWEKITKADADVAIEFTEPSSAYANLKTCLSKQIPVVSGTTGWLEKRTEIEQLCQKYQSAFFYASNYSLGVNLFFEINKQLAKLMNPHQDYDVRMVEIHHTEKKDAPSGTAITLAEGVLGNFERKHEWKLQGQTTSSHDLEITALREALVPGTHSVIYESVQDKIEITHTAHSRHGFALGAVVAAEFLAGKKGVFGMKDLLGIG